MPDLPEIRDASRDVLALLGRVTAAQPRIADDTLRRFVGQLSGRLREVQSQLASQVPAHVAASRARIAAARQKAEAIKASLPEIRRRAEAVEPPPATPEPKVDPGLAPTLRAELLERYGPRPATPRGLPGGNPQRPGWGH